MIGYGYGSGPLVEETSSAEHHYELMALARVLAEGLGLLRDGQDGVSYLEEIRDRMSSTGGSVPEGLETILEGIHGELTQMRTILQAGHNASEAIRQEAQSVLDAHAEAAQNYMGQLQMQPGPDWYPFESVPVERARAIWRAAGGCLDYRTPIRCGSTPTERWFSLARMARHNPSLRPSTGRSRFPADWS